MASALNSTGDIVALGGAAAGALALIACAALAWVVRRLRVAQRAVLGEGEAVDLVAHAVALTREVVALRDYLDEVAARLDARLVEAEHRLDRSISHRALVRYDAYNEMSGHQSLSIALLDATRSGIVLSSILHRDQARLYVKQVRDGESELTLSPEEEEALRLALLRDD
ncbi:MAG: DUF4446 family protein [Solirubrobacteraceae bacterium]